MEDARDTEDELSNSVGWRVCAPSFSRGYIRLVRGLSGCSSEYEDSELSEKWRGLSNAVFGQAPPAAAWGTELTHSLIELEKKP